MEFLEARKILLAEETNNRLAELLHGETVWLEETSILPKPQLMNIGIETEEEEKALVELNEWITEKGFSPGVLSYDFTDPDSGDQQAIFDLVWPLGIQEELSEPVAVLINEGSEILSLANSAGFRCFTSIESFKNYVQREIVKEVEFGAIDY